MSTFIVSSSSALLKALTPLAGVVSNNAVVPALENFLFSVAGGTLTLTASDLEVSLVATLGVQVLPTATFSVLVPARKLLDTLKSLPDQPLTVRLDEQQCRIELVSANGLYKLSGQPASDFPRVPAVGASAALELPGKVLSTAISHTAFALSTDELRPAMTGVLLELTATALTFVATDGHRLLRYRRTDLGALGAPRNVIIPRKAWALLSKAVAGVELVALHLSADNAAFEGGGLRLVTRLIDERYPDYENVIPVSNPNTLTISRPELLGCLRRLQVYANRMNHQVRLELRGAEVQVAAEDLDFSHSATESLAGQYEGEEMKIGFNAKFLVEMLGVLTGDEVRVALSTPNRAGLLAPAVASEGEDVLMLVMPLMLNNYI